MPSRPALSVLVLVGVSAFTGFGQTIPVPRDPNPEGAFVLLHSLLGYERGATKQALIRAVRPAWNRKDAIDLENSLAILKLRGKTETQYQVEYAGKTFGSHWWRIDFSSFRHPGDQFQLVVKLKLLDRTRLELRSEPFPILDDVLFRVSFHGLALQNAQARKAPQAMGGGYFDCNTQMGEAYSHAIYAAGLLAVLDRRGQELGPDVQRKLIRFAERGLDYVVALQRRNGRILDQHGSRPFQGFNPGLVNTTLGTYGLTRGALILDRFDADKAKQYLDAAERAFDYLKHRKADPDMVTLAALLYRATGKAGYLARAASYARAFAIRPDEKIQPELSLEAMPYNEGLMELLELAPDYPDWTLWAHQLVRHGIQLYHQVPSHNVFHIVPWDNIGRTPTESIRFDTCRTSHFSRAAYTMLRLSELFPTSGWERPATASLQWIAGLHYGLPGKRVIPPSKNPATAASFITNLGPRYAKQLTAERQWQAPTIVNGFADGFRYENTWRAAETFILHDGLWLLAVSRYGALPTLTVRTTCAGEPCSAKFEVQLGDQHTQGITSAETGQRKVVLPSWGEAELIVHGAGKIIRFPFFASMGSQSIQHVDLQEQVVVTAEPVRAKKNSPFQVRLRLKNVGKASTKVCVRWQSSAVELDLPKALWITLAESAEKSFLVNLRPTAPNFMVVIRTEWNSGSDLTSIYGETDGLILPIQQLFSRK